MFQRMTKLNERLEARRLRIEQRLSIHEIHRRIRVAKSSLSLWLRDIPLDQEEIDKKKAVGRRKSAISLRKRAQKIRMRPPIALGLASPFANLPQEEMHHSASVAAAAEWFMRRGYMASLPVDQAPYDLIVESDEGLKKIQVKSTRQASPNDASWVVGIHRHVYQHSRNSGVLRQKRVPYSLGEIDFFFVLTIAEDVYLIPLADTARKSNITLSSYGAYKR
jgi:PD-(D/E)XK endonuclease